MISAIKFLYKNVLNKKYDKVSFNRPKSDRKLPMVISGDKWWYWDEKLQISSVQKSHGYDSEETEKRIKDFKDTFTECYGREMNEEEVDWVQRLEDSTSDEHEYIYVAYREKPKDIDYEYVPFGKKYMMGLMKYAKF